MDPGAATRFTASRNGRIVTITLTLLSSVAILLASTQVQPPAAPGTAIQLAIRVFDGTEEVTADTGVTVFTAGSREAPFSVEFRPSTGHIVMVTPGMYDVQAIQQREGEIVNIRWAEHLTVMRYPDEAGEHLEVINFQRGFGALQVRPAPGPPPDRDEWHVSAFPSADRIREAVAPVTGGDYRLFVLPAGRYDLLVRAGSAPIWVTDVEVPLDRTRLKHVPTADR